MEANTKAPFSAGQVVTLKSSGRQYVIGWEPNFRASAGDPVPDWYVSARTLKDGKAWGPIRTFRAGKLVGGAL